MTTVSDTEIDASLQRKRIRLHRSVLPSSMAASAGVGVVLVVMLWPHAAGAGLLLWLAVLALLLVLRLAIGRTQARDGRAEEHAARWLQYHRLGFLLHGLVWAAAGLLLVPVAATPQFDLVLFALAAVVAGALVSLGWDLLAVALFATPPLLVLCAGTLLRGVESDRSLGVMLLLLLAFCGASALRSARAARDGARLQLVQAARAREAQQNSERADDAHRELADQHHLLTQLMQTTHQGFWFVDNEGITTEVNPAMCALLGRPHDGIVGRSVFDFFGGADLQTVRQEVENLRRGIPGGYEVGLVRPDGSRLHCVVHASPLYDAQGARIGAVGLCTDITVRREAEMRLRTYELVVNSITDLVSVTDGGEVYRMVNDAWCRATGVAREQAVGRRSIDALPGSVSPQRQQALQQALHTGRPHSARGAAGTAGLAGRLLETTYYPYADAAAGIRFVAMVTRDITEQERALKLLQASEAEQRALLDAFPGYIGRLDAGLRYTYANRRLAELLGTTPEQMVGRAVGEMLGPGRVPDVRDRVHEVLAGATVTYERHHPGRGGGPDTDVQVTLAAGVDPRSGTPVVFGFGIDISARKRAEEALIAARDEAERANRAKSQFLAQMSHELRTPLNAILGFGQLLQSDTERPLAGRQPAQVREILRGAKHLLALINEILDLGRIEAGNLRLEPETVPLAPLIDECLALMQALALEHQVRLLPPQGAPLSVCADRTRLKQVLLNLLGNAIKYNQRGGSVALRCSLHEGRARIEVQDTGPGLDEDERARLFQPFERLGAAHTGIEGTGIGLALSRGLVQGMGGEIGVDSQPGMGSLFWLLLPAGPNDATAAPPPEAAAAAPPAAAEAAAAVSHTVLYIEDNAVNVVLMEAMLMRLPGLRLLSAALPLPGLALAEQERPDLVLLDIQLPGMDGFEVLARLREMPALRDTPVVAVSANAVPADIETARAAGFTDYLTKPLELQQLLSTVQRLLAPAPGRPPRAPGSVQPPA